MSLPRQVLPDKFWFLTRRATQREFLLRPDDAMNNAFLYCLIEAAQKFEIRLLLTQMMSNHDHTVVYDPHGMAVEFYHRFHTHLAKCVNALRGRWENMWSSEPTCLVELTDSGAVLDKLVYTATNPVKDGLVEKVHHWPGPKTLNALFNGRVLHARRPDFLFRDDGTMPEEVETELASPRSSAMSTSSCSSCADRSPRSRPRARATAKPPAARWSVGAPSDASRGATARPAASPGATCGRASPDGASGHASRRSSATATSSRSTAPRARDGSPASPPCFRSAPTGCTFRERAGGDRHPRPLPSLDT